MAVSKFIKWKKEDYECEANLENQFVRRHGEKLINLQLVEREAIMKEEEVMPSQRGKQAGTLKRKINYNQIFSDAAASKGEMVLLEGDAGIGKSTFCTTFARGWAKGEILKQFDLLLLLPLRLKEVSTATSLIDLLNFLVRDEEELCADVAAELKEKRGRGVLVVADGWDELGEENRSEDSCTFLYKFILKGVLKFASVLITSRPSASAPLHNESKIKHFVEVVGFNREDMEEFIKSEFPKEVTDLSSSNLDKSPEKASRLIEQLDSNPLIESLCVVPLNCAIICYLWRELEENLPNTMTALYSKVIQLIVTRSILKKKSDYEKIKSLSSFDFFPDEDLQQKWWKLCKFAFHAIEKDQLVFTHDEVKHFFPKGIASVDEQQNILGLLQSFESLLSGGVRRGLSFHFLHLTFQEFLAARHLARQSPDKQLEVIESYAESPHFRMVWRFFFGISCTQPLHKESDLSEQQFSQEVVAAFVNKVTFNETSNLFLCHCSFESGNNNDVNIIKENVLNHCIEAHTAYDCTAVVSVISNTQSCDGMHINFSGCSLGDKGIKSLIEALASKSGMLQVETLDLSGNKLTDKSVRALLNRAAASLKSLNELRLSQNPLRASGIKALEKSVHAGTLASLKSLSLVETLTSDSEINADFLGSFVEALSSLSYLSQLNLYKNNLQVRGAKCLGKALSQMFGKEKLSSKLDLRETMLGDKGVYEFIQNIQATSYLKELYLNDNNIHGVGVSSLADGIRSGNLNLTCLYLDNNPLGLDGVVAIGRMLSSSNCQLETLSVRNCQLTVSVDHNTDTVNKSDLTTSSTSHDTKLTISEVRQQLCQMPQNNTLTYLNVAEHNFNGGNNEVLAGLMYLCQSLSGIALERISLAPFAVKELSHQLHCLHTANLSTKLSGSRVVRGRDWHSGDEDGGEGHVGTVVEIGEPSNGGRRAAVQWDCGNRGSYCCGVDGKYELRILHNPGVQHDYARCDSCGANPIIGYRWNCVKCYDYDLCTTCYMAFKVVKNDSQKHEFECHEFECHDHTELLDILRMRYHFNLAVRVPPRAGAKRVEAKGMFQEATVVNLDHGGDNGRDVEIGMVSFLQYKDNVELKGVVATSGGFYYPDHLPMLGASRSVQEEYFDMIRHTQQLDNYYEETSGDDPHEVEHMSNDVKNTEEVKKDDQDEIQHQDNEIQVTGMVTDSESDMDIFPSPDESSSCNTTRRKRNSQNSHDHDLNVNIKRRKIKNEDQNLKGSTNHSSAGISDGALAPKQDLISDIEYQAESGNIDTLSATKLWKLRDIHSKLNGEGITIAILDTAIDTQHDAFRSAIRDGRIEILPTRCEEDKVIGNHGMMAAFVAGGESFDGVSLDETTTIMPSGVAPKARLLICPTGPRNKWSAVNHALDQLIERKKKGGSLHIVSMSFGVEYERPCDSITQLNQEAVSEKIRSLTNHKVICLAASGNYGNYKGGVLFPARLNDVISVGSLTVKGHQRDSNASDGIDVCAPGESIAAPEYCHQADSHELNRFHFVNGSSCAAPAIARLLALVLQHAKQEGKLKTYDLTYIKTELFPKDMRRGSQFEPYKYFTQNCRVDVEDKKAL